MAEPVRSDLTRPDAPQPPARRQLRLGDCRDLRARLPARCSRPSNATRASTSPSTTPVPSSTGSPPSGPTFSTASPRSSARGQVEIVGGGWYEPVLAALPERDRVGQLVRMADELERRFGTRPRGAWLAERVWEPDLPTVAHHGRLRLDGPRRRPLPGGGDPRGGALGPVHDRRPGQGPDGLRHGAGPPLPDPVLRGRATSSATSATTRPRRATGSGRWATTARSSVAGRRPSSTAGVDPAGSTNSSRRSRRTPDWLTTITPSGWLDGHGPVGRVYLPTGLLRGDGRVGTASRRGARVRPRRQGGQGRRAGPRHAGCAARSGATSRSSTARSTTSTSRCSASATSSRRCREAAPATPPATTSTPASRTILTGTACSAGSTCPTCGSRPSVT